MEPVLNKRRRISRWSTTFCVLQQLGHSKYVSTCTRIVTRWSRYQFIFSKEDLRSWTANKVLAHIAVTVSIGWKISSRMYVVDKMSCLLTVMHVITRLLHCNTLWLRHPSAAIYKSTYPCLHGHNIFTMASSSSLFITIALLALLGSWQAAAYDPSPLQDFCVRDMKSPGMYVYIRTGGMCECLLLVSMVL